MEMKQGCWKLLIDVAVAGALFGLKQYNRTIRDDRERPINTRERPIDIDS